MRPVLRNVSLSVQRGEAVGLLGPNGAGKTTCFYVMIGLMTPNYGSVHLDGMDISSLAMHKRARLGIGYLPQEASIFRGLTVEQNIRAVAEMTEQNKDRCDSFIEDSTSGIFYKPFTQNTGPSPFRWGAQKTRDCSGTRISTQLYFA